MITVREYLDLRGRSPFEEWFESLDAPVAAEVTTALVRIEQGNFSNTGVSAPASMDAGSNSDPDIESTSGKNDEVQLNGLQSPGIGAEGIKIHVLGKCLDF